MKYSKVSRKHLGVVCKKESLRVPSYEIRLK